jgi:hypothetical protein
MIAPGNILQDDLILELVRHLNLGYGNEVSELIVDRPQLLAEKASRALRRQIAFIGSNDFGEEIYRVGAEAEAPALAGWGIEPVMPCADAKVNRAGHRSPFDAFDAFDAFGALRRLFACSRHARSSATSHKLKSS